MLTRGVDVNFIVMIRPHKIILVEDNQADAELTKIALKEIPAPHELVHLLDGNELLRFLEEEPLSNVALILLDLNMPQPDGKVLLTQFCADTRLRNVPIVIFSSSIQQSDISDCYSVGANAYVRKPIDMEEFRKAVQAIAMFWLEINVLPASMM